MRPRRDYRGNLAFATFFSRDPGVSMRPRRDYRGNRAGQAQGEVDGAVSMRPRRDYRGNEWTRAFAVRLAFCFNEAPA